MAQAISVASALLAALIGFVALDAAGYAAALYYTVGYLLMVLAAFSVIAWVAREGGNVALGDLALERDTVVVVAS